MIGTPWLFGGVAVALGAMAFGWWINTATMRADHKTEVDRLTAELKTANESVGTCHANVAGLDASVKAQGKDIRDLADATATAGKQAAEAAKQGAAASKAARDSAKAILAIPLPPPDMACLEAARLLRGAP